MQKGVRAFVRMSIRPFDKSDALKLLLKSVPNAAKRVELTGSYQTPSGSEAEVSFRGDLDDATPVKDFLNLSSGPPSLLSPSRSATACCG